jgi:hypothetical protein
LEVASARLQLLRQAPDKPRAAGPLVVLVTQVLVLMLVLPVPLS